MKIARIQQVNQLESNLFVRHKIDSLKDGEFIQRCVHCGDIIEDYTPNENEYVVFRSEGHKDGLTEGYVFIKKSGRSRLLITEKAISDGLFSVPNEVVDCIIINS